MPLFRSRHPSDTSRDALHSLGDWGSRVQISPLRPDFATKSNSNSGSRSGPRAPVCKPFAEIGPICSGGMQKPSPASAATERGAIRSKSKSSRREITKGAPNCRPNARERHYFWVAHGQMNVCFLAQADNEFNAHDAIGRRTGVFESIKATAGAVSDRCRGDR